MIAAIVALALFQTGAGGARKQMDALLNRIDRLAASEPPAYGVDTRIRVAEILRAGYPALSKRELHDAEASLAGVTDVDYANASRVRISIVLGPIDFSEAERVARSIEPDRKYDRLAQAYGHLLESRGKRDALELILTALHSGAFRLHYDSNQFGTEQQ